MMLGQVGNASSRHTVLNLCIGANKLCEAPYCIGFQRGFCMYVSDVNGIFNHMAMCAGTGQRALHTAMRPLRMQTAGKKRLCVSRSGINTEWGRSTTLSWNLCFQHSDQGQLAPPLFELCLSITSRWLRRICNRKMTNLKRIWIVLRGLPWILWFPWRDQLHTFSARYHLCPPLFGISVPLCSILAFVALVFIPCIGMLYLSLGICHHHTTDFGKGSCASCNWSHGMEAAQRWFSHSYCVRLFVNFGSHQFQALTDLSILLKCCSEESVSMILPGLL